MLERYRPDEVLTLGALTLDAGSDVVRDVLLLPDLDRVAAAVPADAPSQADRVRAARRPTPEPLPIDLPPLAPPDPQPPGEATLDALPAPIRTSLEGLCAEVRDELGEVASATDAETAAPALVAALGGALDAPDADTAQAAVEALVSAWRRCSSVTARPTTWCCSPPSRGCCPSR